MLAAWLAGLSLDDFRARYYQREPFAGAGSARAAAGLAEWAIVRQLVERGTDLLAVRNGRLLPEPRTADEAQALFRCGASLVLRGCEGKSEALAGVARQMERDLEGEVAVQLFATPAGYWSFGWHYDCEEVFIVQTQGVKDYRLRANTVNPAPTLDAMPRDMQFEKETSPLVACTLVPGDWLYVPRGFWHRALARENSLSLSIGVLSAAARGGAPARRRAGERRASGPSTQATDVPFSGDRRISPSRPAR